MTGSGRGQGGKTRASGINEGVRPGTSQEIIAARSRELKGS